jgi:hypothetical protein
MKITEPLCFLLNFFALLNKGRIAKPTVTAKQKLIQTAIVSI